MKPVSTFKILAYIREAECIGCTKCIQACPFDAIIGASHEMHTVIAEQCIGCDLCIPACPVDCIDKININEPSADIKQIKLQQAKKRHHARKNRLAAYENNNQAIQNDAANKKNYVLEAIKRSKSKK